MSEKQKSSKQGRNAVKCSKYRARHGGGTQLKPHPGRKLKARFISITAISTGPVLLQGEASVTEALMREADGRKRNRVHHLPFPRGYQKPDPDAPASPCPHCLAPLPRRAAEHIRKCKRDHHVPLVFQSVA